jgi:hypothetical protein
VRRLFLLFLGLAALLLRDAEAQSTADLFQQGVRAYRRAEFEAAAALLRRAVDFSGKDSSSLAEKSGVLDYLAAAEFFRGKRDSAVAVYRRTLQRNPRHQVDDVIFPPEVTSVFDEVRRGIKTAAADVAADTVFKLEGGRWTVRLLASSYHQVNALVLSSDGAVVYDLYGGPLEDSLTVQWDMRDSLHQAVRSGNYSLSIVSTSGGRTVRLFKLPLSIYVTRPDTLALPKPLNDSLFLPEKTGTGPAIRSLLGGLGLGLVASALPSMIASGAQATPARFVIGGAVGIAGVAGFVAHRGGRPLEKNIAANEARRTEWKSQMEAASRENAVRRADIRVTVRTGVATTVGSGLP